MDNLPIPQSRIENLMNAFISCDSGQISTPQSRIEEFWYHLIEGTNALPIPQSRVELLLKKIIENDTEQIPLAKSRAEEFLVSILTGDINKLPIPQSRSEYYLDYIARNNLVLDDIEYVKYSDTNITASNTVQKPFRSAILKGSTKYRDIDTGEVLDAFEDGRNLELVSVKMPVLTTTGKNLFDGKMEIGSIDNKGDVYVNVNHKRCVNFIPVKENTTYTISKEKAYDGYLLVHQYDENKNFIKYNPVGIYQKGIFTTDSNTRFVKFRYEKVDDNNFQIEEGSVATSYEPFKSNILSTNEDVTLRGIGDVQDELNLLTGEVVERIGELVITDTTPSKGIRVTDNGMVQVNIPISVFNTGDGTTSKDNIRCDKFTWSEANILNPQEGLRVNGNTLYWAVSISKLSSTDLIGVNNYLSNNPITVQYQLATEKSIKTVDLKVVDQDDNPVKQLSAFDETTHIVSSSASDNSLIAIAEVEVPTKLIEALDNIKLLSSDVGMLIDEVDAMQKTQDENSTMVMSAMTELYEMVLVMGGGS